MDQGEILQDIRERLARIETKMDRYPEIERKAFEAYNMALSLQAEMCQVKEGTQWNYRTAVLSLIGAVTAIVVAFITRKWG